MVAVGVHRLLVVGVAGVLRRDRRLVDADVGRLQRPLGEVDDGRMNGETVERATPPERELPAPPVLFGPEGGAVLGHLRIPAA